MQASVKEAGSEQGSHMGKVLDILSIAEQQNADLSTRNAEYEHMTDLHCTKLKFAAERMFAFIQMKNGHMRGKVALRLSMWRASLLENRLEGAAEKMKLSEVQFQLASELSTLVLKSETSAREQEMHSEHEIMKAPMSLCCVRLTLEHWQAEMANMKENLLKSASSASLQMGVRSVKKILEGRMEKGSTTAIKAWRYHMEHAAIEKKRNMEVALLSAREAREACADVTVDDDAEVSPLAALPWHCGRAPRLRPPHVSHVVDSPCLTSMATLD